jgi:hypothetical protein
MPRMEAWLIGFGIAGLKNGGNVVLMWAGLER